MVNAGILKKSKSPYSNPALIINKDGKLRLVLNSRKLNSILKKNSIPLPRIQDTIYKMGSKSMFCCLDLAKGYLQIPLTQSLRQLTAFSIPGIGHYQFCSLPLGLTVAPAEFQA
uniref:Retrotransposon-like protein 1 (inferred by orthology to a human protein) n=1 Tax=Strongyloides venezuelensis TaxID=75913 RepID=A0A0K0FRX1_STRVS